MSLTAVILFSLMSVAAAILTLFFIGGRMLSRIMHPAKPETPSAKVPVIHTQNAFLRQKIDERRRIMDEYHHTRITDEYYELVFETQDGELIRISCSKNAYQNMPFSTAGTLTHTGGRLMRFRTEEQVVSDEYH